MKLDDRLARELREEVRCYARALLEHPDVPVDAARVERIKALELLQRLQEPRVAGERVLAVAIVLASALIAVALWLGRVRSVPVRATVTTGQLTFVKPTAAVLAWLSELSVGATGVECEGVTVDGLGRVFDGAEGVRITADAVRFGDVVISSADELSLRSSPETGELELVLPQGALSATAFAQGTVRIEAAGQVAEAVSAQPDSIRIFSPDRRTGTVVLRFRAPRPIALRTSAPPGPVQLSFSEHASLSGTAFQSAIVGGSVALLDVGREIELATGDALAVDVAATRATLGATPERVSVEVSGTAGRLLAGPPSMERDLRPSWLEHLLQHRGAQLLWGAVLFLSGLLWNIKTILWRK